MIRASLFAFDLPDIASRRSNALKKAKPSEQDAASEKVDESDSDRLSRYLYSEGVFWGVYHPY